MLDVLGLLDLKDVMWCACISVRLPVYRQCRLLARRFGEAEHVAGGRVVPVYDVAHAVLVLAGEVFSMGLGKLSRRHTRQYVQV